MSATQPEYPSPPLARERDSRMGLGARVALLILILFGEKFALNFCINTQRADTAAGAAAVVRLAQHIGFRFAIPFSLALAIFVMADRERALQRVNAEARSSGIGGGWLTLHARFLPRSPSRSSSGTGVMASGCRWWRFP